MRRYFCIYFPRWFVQCERQNDEATASRPLAVFQRSAHGLRIIQCSAEAQKLGIRRGFSVADARALTRELILKEADFSAYRAELEKICQWAGCFSPLAGIDEWGEQPQALFLDITGCETIFQGEKNLLSRALNGLKLRGFKARAAVAPTLGAAWALAHFGEQAAIIPNDYAAVRESLEPLPAASLRVSAELVDDLAPLGLCRVSDILKQPRSALPSRFGEILPRRLDEALGDVAETLPLYRPAPEFRVARAFEYPVRNAEILFNIVEQLTAQLSNELQTATRGVRRMECWLFHEMAQPVCAEISLFKSSANPKHLWKLLHTRLEDIFRTPSNRAMKISSGMSIEADEGVCAVALQVMESDALDHGQLALFDSAEKTRSNGELALLMDRLAMRLGADAVLRAQLADDALPEHSFGLVPMDAKLALENASVPFARPLKLLAEPQAISVETAPSPALLTHDGQQIRIMRAAGPERIESGWWRNSYARRDYFVVDTNAAGRLWIFRRLDDRQWFLHGYFS